MRRASQHVRSSCWYFALGNQRLAPPVERAENKAAPCCAILPPVQVSFRAPIEPSLDLAESGQTWPKAAQLWSSRVQVWSLSAQLCAKLVEFGAMFAEFNPNVVQPSTDWVVFGPKSGPSQPKAGRFGPSLVDIRHVCPIWPEAGRNRPDAVGLAKFGRIRPNLPERSLDLVNHAPELVEIAPHEVSIGQNLAEPNPNQVWPPTDHWAMLRGKCSTDFLER